MSKFTGEQCPHCGKRHIAKCDEPGTHAEAWIPILFIGAIIALGIMAWSFQETGIPPSPASLMAFAVSFIVGMAAILSKCQTHRRCEDCGLIFKP